MDVAPPAHRICADCGEPSIDVCPLCDKALCRECAEKPYTFCCDGEDYPPARIEGPSPAGVPEPSVNPRRQRCGPFGGGHLRSPRR
jgi:hypothetical protein